MVEPDNAVARHSLAVYDELVKRATAREDGVLEFSGKLTAVFAYLGISSAMYSRVRRVLIISGSIEILQKGAGGQPSIILIHDAPDTEKLSDPALTSARRLATMVVQLEKRVADLEARIPFNVLETLRDFEVRLGRMEVAVSSQKNVSDGESSSEYPETDG